MAVAPRGHRHRGRADNPFFYFTASRMAVAANKGADCGRAMWMMEDGHVEEEVGRKQFQRVCAGEAAGTPARVWQIGWSTNTGVCRS